MAAFVSKDPKDKVVLRRPGYLAHLDLVGPVRAALFAIANLALSLNTAAALDDSEIVPSEYRGTALYLMHQADDSVADYHRWLEAFIPQQTDGAAVKPGITAGSASDFVTQYRRLPRDVQRYGIWLTLERNDVDSHFDRAVVERLKALCKKNGLPLFIRTGHASEWRQISGPSLEGDVYRPRNLPSWSVCTSWSPLQRALIGTWAMPLWVDTDYENGVPRITVSGEVVEHTFTDDHRYIEGIRGEPTLLTGRWCLEGNRLILQFDTQPKREERIPWQQTRERIARISDKEVIFTITDPVWANPTAEGVWARVR